MTTDSHSELLKMVNDLTALMERSRQEKIPGSLARLRNVCKEINRVWSGSCRGYHSRVYRPNFEPPATNIFSFDSPFDPRVGLSASYLSYGSEPWREYHQEVIQETILERAGNISLNSLQAFQDEGEKTFRDCKHAILSIIDITTRETPSSFLEGMKNSTLQLSIKTIRELNSEALARINLSPSNDKRAVAEGKQLPIHWIFVNYVDLLSSVLESITKLSEIADQTAKHIARQDRRLRQRTAGSKVFIGHGRSQDWRELKDFIEESLGLSTDEFNRAPVAGFSTKERLSEMLDEATIAFLIMTGEDEQPDGKSRARENVVHEVGLFQGRLGFERAIVLFEEGCEEFSNIAGLGQIRFPKGSIKAAFQEVREVCEREELLLP